MARVSLGAALSLILLVCLGLASAGPAQAAKYASIVVDAETGEVLHARHSNTRRYPASLVKMMTLYMTFDALERGRLKMNQGLRVSRRAAGMPASKLGLRRGQVIRVKEAILALVTKSANDAAVVLAEAIGKTESQFAQKMTRKARQLGMKRTTFRNASGLPNRKQRSTARDMATLARALMNDFPQYYKFFKTKSFKYRGRVYRNHNRLLKTYAGADGIKTGYIRAAGYNLVASSIRNGRRVIAVVFGGKSARSRNRHTAQLLDKGFKQLRMLARNYPDPPPRKPVAIAAAQPTQQQAVAAARQASQQPAAGTAATTTLPTGAAEPVQRQNHGGTSLETAAIALAAPGSEALAANVGQEAQPAASVPFVTETTGSPSNGAVPPPAAVERQPLTSNVTGNGQAVVAAQAAPQVAPQVPPQVAAPKPASRKPKPSVANGIKAGTSLEFEIVQPRRKPGRYGVQVGAFYRYRPAKRAAQRAVKKAPQLLADADISITHVRGARGKLYRGRIVGLTKKDARLACRKLRSVKIDCMVVRVGNMRVALDPARSNLASN